MAISGKPPKPVHGRCARQEPDEETVRKLIHKGGSVADASRSRRSRQHQADARAAPPLSRHGGGNRRGAQEHRRQKASGPFAACLDRRGHRGEAGEGKGIVGADNVISNVEYNVVFNVESNVDSGLCG